VDAYPAEVRFLTCRAAWLAVCAAAVFLTGCSRGAAPPERAAAPPPAGEPSQHRGPTVTATGRGNTFHLDDPQGRRVLEAEADEVDGTLKPGLGFDGDVVFRQVRARLFREGEPQIDLVTSEARWDGERLISDHKTQGTTPDGLTQLEAEKSVWTAKTGELALEQARVETLPKNPGPKVKTRVIHARKVFLFNENDETRAEEARMESMRNQTVDFTITAARASVLDDVVTMPAGATGRSPNGTQVKGDRVRWNIHSGDLEAVGNVSLTNPTSRLTGERLKANTELKKGRFLGRTRGASNRSVNARS
jgi:hypothetical protein